ncbi:unnamed protein product [Nyctereutes procyonoides]|uniref:(raccoon dog) hypothetical protein n=1 Tax=Nyctereutes procyonoides TaxID=34880 RepID=A0A811YQ54_NYCPR|nr:unnamed protein product [Nyctereutes procyonoides]
MPVPNNIIKSRPPSGCLQISSGKENINSNNYTAKKEILHVLGEKILHVLGSVRDLVVEILFEQDNEEKIKQLAEILVAIGGTSVLPGFLHRLCSVSKEYYNQTGRIPDWCSLNNPPLEMMFDVGKAQPPLMKRAFSAEK